MTGYELSTSMSTDYFDEAAAAWDDEPRRVALARAIGETIVREVKPNRSMDILDYGCGTGLVSLFLLSHVRSVTGADSSPGMLDVLRSKIAQATVAGMRAILLDLERDPVPAERFHMIAVSMAMHHVAQIEQILRTFWQLLLPGGTLCIADLDPESGSFHAPQVAGRVHHHGFDREVLKHQLSAAGFTQTHDTTAITFTKPVADGREEEFSVFLIWAKRNASTGTTPPTG
jgi:ubiquinone/menaquinone biosynthesis C-methylase UbiE